MRRSVAMVCAVALVVLGCADDEPAQTIAPPEPDPSEESEVDPGAEAGDVPEAGADREDLDLEDGLLRLDDMPTGWTEEPISAEDEGADAFSFCGVPPLDEIAAIDQAARSFEAGDVGPFLEHMVARYEEGEAAEVMGFVLETLDRCEEWTEETDDGPMTFRPSPLSFPGFGDETVAVRISVEADIVDLTMDMIAWRHGDLLSLITSAEAFGTPDAAQTEEFVTSADERLDDLN